MFRRASAPPGTPPEDRIERLEMVVADLKDELTSSVLAKQYAVLNLKDQVSKCEAIEAELVAANKKLESKEPSKQFVQASQVRIAVKNQDAQWVSTSEAELIISDLYARVIEEEERATATSTERRPLDSDQLQMDQESRLREDWQLELKQLLEEQESRLREDWQLELDQSLQEQESRQKLQYEEQLKEQESRQNGLMEQLGAQKEKFELELSSQAKQFESDMADQQTDLDLCITELKDEYENKLAQDRSRILLLEEQVEAKQTEVHNLIEAVRGLEKELNETECTECVVLKAQIAKNAEENEALDLAEQTSLWAEHAAELSRLAETHATQISRLGEEHTAEIARLDEEHAAEIARLDEERATEIARLDGEHAAEISSEAHKPSKLQKEHTADEDNPDITDLKRTVEENETQIMDLIQQLAEAKAGIAPPTESVPVTPTAWGAQESARLETVAVLERLVRLRGELERKLSDATMATATARNETQTWKHKYEEDIRAVTERVSIVLKGLPKGGNTRITVN